MLGLVAGDALEPPLMGGLVRGDENQVVHGLPVVQVVEIARQEVEGRVLHAVVEIAHHGGQRLVRIGPKALAVKLHGLRADIQHGLAGTFVEGEIIAGNGHITDLRADRLEFRAGRDGKCPPGGEGVAGGLAVRLQQIHWQPPPRTGRFSG